MQKGTPVSRLNEFMSRICTRLGSEVVDMQMERQQKESKLAKFKVESRSCLAFSASSTSHGGRMAG